MQQVLKPNAALPGEPAAAAPPEAPPPKLSEAYFNPRGPLKSGGVVGILTVLGLAAWAVLAPIGSATVAPGWIVVESSHQIIQHLEGGIIKEILVHDGSVVKAGDVLLRMDNTRSQAQLKIYQADVDSLEAYEARLLAEQNGSPTLTFPPQLLARQNDPEVAGMLASQVHLFQARRAALDGQKSILEQRIAQYKQQIVGFKSLETSKREQARYIKEELDGLVGLLNQGIVTKTQVLTLEREASRLEGERGEHIASIAGAERGIGETQVQSFQIEKERQEEIGKELRTVQDKLTEVRQAMVTASDVGHRVDIVAPVAGTVMSLAYHTVGGVITPGTPIMEILPTDDLMVVDCQISPIDIDAVRINGEVALQVTAVNTRLTPAIYGKLVSISPDRITDQKSGMSYYKGRITITKEQRERLGDLHLHTGMQVGVFIARKEQSVFHLVLKPLFENLSRSIREK